MSLARESCSFLLLLPGEETLGAWFVYGFYLACRLSDGQTYIGTRSGVIRCRMVRQLSVQERFVLSIKENP